MTRNATYYDGCVKIVPIYRAVSVRSKNSVIPVAARPLKTRVPEIFLDFPKSNIKRCSLLHACKFLTHFTRDSMQRFARFSHRRGVRPSVRLSHSGIVSTCCKLGPRNRHHGLPRRL